MTRLEAVAELQARLGPLLTEVTVTAEDTTGNLKEPLDDALAAMGVARADRPTADPEDGDRFVLEAEYHTLRKVVRLLVLRFDVSSEGDSLRLRQVFENARAMLAESGERLREAGGLQGTAWAGALELAFSDAPPTDEFGSCWPEVP